MRRGDLEPPAEREDRGHPLFQSYLADVAPADLPALRHLLICTLCRRLAKLVLLEIPALPEEPCGRPRRRS